MSTFNPIKAEQNAYTQPVDGIVKNVASILPFLQGLADGAFAGARVGFNWAGVIASTFAVTEACFDPVDQAWWIVGSGGTDRLRGSWDRGRNFTAATISAGVTLSAVATDSSGNGLAIDTSSGAYFGARSAFATVVWTHHNTVISIAPTAAGTALCWDSVHANWICVYIDIAINRLHGEFLHGAGFAFTVGTVPASWGSTTYSFALVNCDHGTAIASALSTGGAFLLARSTDGGANWTAPTFPAGVAQTMITRPTYDPVLSTWYVACSSAAASTLYRSVDDGATWTTNALTFALADVAAINGVLVGLDFLGRILRSFDGITWVVCLANAMSNAPSAGNTKLRAGDGQLLEISRDDAHIAASLVLGCTGGTP